MEPELKQTEESQEVMLSSRKLFTQQKSFFIILISLLVLLLVVFPFGGESLIERAFKETLVKKENLVPNPGFEKGSGSQPAGWTTESKRIVEQ